MTIFQRALPGRFYLKLALVLILVSGPGVASAATPVIVAGEIKFYLHTAREISGPLIFTGPVGAFFNTGVLGVDSAGLPYTNGILFEKGATITNHGDIRGATAVKAQEFLNLSNFGQIQGQYGGVDAGTDGTLINRVTGIITSGDTAVSLGGYWFIGNEGAISGGSVGVSAVGKLYLYNYGGASITGNSTGAVLSGDVQILNHGTISSRSVGIHGTALIYGSLDNGPTGIISGGTIGASLDGLARWSIHNSGKIISGGGVALQLGSGDDDVRLVDNGSFIGLVDFGGGNDILDLSEQDGSTTIEVANLGQIVGSTNYLLQGNKIYLTESRASGSGVLSANTGGVAGALGTVIDGALAGDLFDGLESGAPMAYADQPSFGSAADATAAALADGQARPSQRAWITAFGGGSTGADLSSVFGGIVAGSHARVSDGLDVGLLAGYTRGVARTDGDHELTADTMLFGPYGRIDLGAAELTFSLIGGVSANASARTIDADVASATFSSIFVAPSLGVEIPVLTGQGSSFALTASATYVTGLVAGYSETGSSQNLTLGEQTLGQLDTRLGASAKFDLPNGHHTIRAGAFYQAHTGSTSVPVTLLDTTRSVDTSQPDGYGLYAGYALQLDLTATLALTTAVDGSWRNDGQRTAAARIKLGGAL